MKMALLRVVASVFIFSFMLNCGAVEDSRSHTLTSDSQRLITPKSDEYSPFWDALSDWGDPLSLGASRVVMRPVDYNYYTGGFNCDVKSSLWIMHFLDEESVTKKPENNTWRDYDFKPDEKLPFSCRTYSSDFTNSGFDRGHLAPAKDFQAFGTAAVEDSFFTSNISPQVGIGFNRHLWASLEKATRSWAVNKKKILIYTGPIYDDVAPKDIQFIGYFHQIRVPDAFYKVIVNINNVNSPKVLAFIMRNVDHRNIEYPNSKQNPKCDDFVKSIYNPLARKCPRDNISNIERHQVKLTEVESQAHITFFPDMAASLSKKIKTKKEKIWEYDPSEF